MRCPLKRTLASGTIFPEATNLPRPSRLILRLGKQGAKAVIESELFEPAPLEKARGFFFSRENF